MSSIKSRLFEALRVIREDSNRRNAVEAEKLARTQYRDGFHLRRPPAIAVNPINVWRDDDTSDDDYSPNKRKAKRKLTRDEDCGENGTTSKRSKKRKKSTVLTSTENDGIVEADGGGGRTKKQTPIIPNADPSEECGIHDAFITLRLSSPRGQKRLSLMLERHPDTDLNAYVNADSTLIDPSPWRLSRGGLHRANRSMFEHEQDYELQRLINERTPRALRSGKISPNFVPKKHKRDESDTDMDIETRSHKEGNRSSKRAKRDCSKIRHDNKELDDTAHLPSCGVEPVQNWGSPAASRKRNSYGHGWNMLHNTIDKAQEAQGSKQQCGSSPSDAILVDDEPASCSSDTISATSSLQSAQTSSTAITTPLSSPDNNQFFSARQASPSNYRIITLSTSFSHPINFKSKTAAACTFHTDYRHSILGHGLTRGQYLIFPNQPSQLIEMESGHRSKDIPADTMCIRRAVSYLQIIRCETHTFKSISPTPQIISTLSDGGKAYMQDLYTRLKRGHPDRSTKALIPACSLCPAPAAWQCTTPQIRDKCLQYCRLPHETNTEALIRIDNLLHRQQQSTSCSTTINPRNINISLQPPIHGCDLKLCSTCIKVIRDKHNGQMASNRINLLTTVRNQPLGLRADVEFLFKEGLVWKAYHLDNKKKKKG